MTPRIPSSRIALFALPALPVMMAHIPVGAIIPSFYAKHTAASMAAIGSVFLVSRIFDAMIDPVIGHMSDRTRGPFGRRKPWVVAGAVVMVLAVWALFTPAPDAGAGWLMAASMALFLGWGMLEIPYRAWSVELSRDYAERTKISTAIAVMGALGTLLFMAIPMLPIFASSEIGPQTMMFMAVVIAVLLPACVALAVWRVPEGDALPEERSTGLEAIRSLAKNRPLFIFVVTFIFGGLGTGAFTAVFYLFVDNHLGIGDRFAMLYVASAAANLAGMPLWHRVMQRIGRHRALALSWGSLVFVQLAMLAVPKGEAAFVPMIGLALAFGFAEAATKVAPYAMVGDIVDYETWRSGIDRSGSYFSFMILIAKLNFAIGGGAAFLLLGLIGYSATGVNTGFAASGLIAVFVGLPVLLWAAAAVMATRFPITRKRQDIIRRRIESRTRAI
ncbi:MFS transporter [Sphingosinicella xenopeptidilytica]|uniref:MFS transporter n=1 Tax=Sphingosinicella xenopeptidilytica TaxID=364098 RepID=A0ABW3CAE0_SPHXN